MSCPTTYHLHPQPAQHGSARFIILLDYVSLHIHNLFNVGMQGLLFAMRVRGQSSLFPEKELGGKG